MLAFFANPWGLLGLVAVPAVLAIHLFQRRFPPLEVAGLHLWGVQAPTAEAGRRRDRLPVSPSLILEVLLATLLALLLAQPRWGATATVRHVVAVLDGSASMSAESATGETFAERAVATLADRDATGPPTVWTVVASGTRPVVLAGPRLAWDEVSPTLADWTPTASRHDPKSAWDLAGEIANIPGLATGLFYATFSHKQAG
ncbi:MAG: BatA domain-containing protein [Planctomycetota bacterium]